jgi:hypothetical protein
VIVLNKEVRRVRRTACPPFKAPTCRRRATTATGCEQRERINFEYRQNASSRGRLAESNRHKGKSKGLN